MSELILPSLDRRHFLGGLAAAIAAPYVVKSGILMPVRSIIKPSLYRLTEVSEDGINYFALGYLNVKRGRSPDWHGSYSSIQAFAQDAYKYHRVVFVKGWTP